MRHQQGVISWRLSSHLNPDVGSTVYNRGWSRFCQFLQAWNSTGIQLIRLMFPTKAGAASGITGNLVLGTFANWIGSNLSAGDCNTSRQDIYTFKSLRGEIPLTHFSIVHFSSIFSSSHAFPIVDPSILITYTTERNHLPKLNTDNNPKSCKMWTSIFCF